METARLHITFPGSPANEDEIKKLESVEKHVLQLTDARGRGDWESTLKEVNGAIASGADVSPLVCYILFPLVTLDKCNVNQKVCLTESLGLNVQLHTCRVEALLKLSKADDASKTMSKMPKFISAHNQAKIFGMLCQAYIYHVEAQFKLANGR